MARHGVRDHRATPLPHPSMTRPRPARAGHVPPALPTLAPLPPDELAVLSLKAPQKKSTTTVLLAAEPRSAANYNRAHPVSSVAWGHAAPPDHDPARRVILGRRQPPLADVGRVDLHVDVPVRRGSSPKIFRSRSRLSGEVAEWYDSKTPSSSSSSRTR